MNLVDKINNLMASGQEDWWNTPNQAFDGKRPKDLLETEKGIGQLEIMIKNIETGEFL